MSAREAFYPNQALARGSQRPASRLRNDQGRQNISDTREPPFTIDQSNPLHGSLSGVAAGQKNDQGMSALDASENVPLPISGLFSKKPDQGLGRARSTTARLSRDSGAENSRTLRPGTADPNSKALQQRPSLMTHENLNPRVFEPTPVQAIHPTPPLFSSNASHVLLSVSSSFKGPALALAMPSQSSPGEVSENDAHTSASNIDSSSSKPPSLFKQTIGPLSESITRTSAVSSEEVQHSKYRPNMSNQSGPQRIIVDSASHSGIKHRNGGGYPHSAADVDMDVTRGRNKRSLNELNEMENANDFGEYAQSNLFKKHQPDERYYENSAIEGSLHSLRGADYSFAPQSESPSNRRRTGERLLRTPELRDENHYSRIPSPGHSGHVDGALDRLLGYDVNAYIEGNAEKYEVAAMRWRDCQITEWIAGGEEVMGRFNKIIQFVQAHMTSKMLLFASFDTKVQSHNAILEDREKVLSSAKARLVKESETVLGPVVLD